MDHSCNYTPLYIVAFIYIIIFEVGFEATKHNRLKPSHYHKEVKYKIIHNFNKHFKKEELNTTNCTNTKNIKIVSQEFAHLCFRGGFAVLGRLTFVSDF